MLTSLIHPVPSLQAAKAILEEHNLDDYESTINIRFNGVLWLEDTSQASLSDELLLVHCNWTQKFLQQVH